MSSSLSDSRWASSSPANVTPDVTPNVHDGLVARPVSMNICRFGPQCRYGSGCMNRHPERSGAGVVPQAGTLPDMYTSVAGVVPQAGTLPDMYTSFAGMLVQSDYARRAEHSYYVGGLAWAENARQAEHKALRDDTRRTEGKVEGLAGLVEAINTRQEQDRAMETRHRERMEEFMERLDNAGVKAGVLERTVDDAEVTRESVQELERRVEALNDRQEQDRARETRHWERMEEFMGRLDNAGVKAGVLERMVYWYYLCTSGWWRWLPLSRRYVACGIAIALLLAICINSYVLKVEVQDTTASTVGPTPYSLANQPSPLHHIHNPLNPKITPTARAHLQPLSPVLSNGDGAIGHTGSLPNRVLQSILYSPTPLPRSRIHVVITALALMLGAHAFRIPVRE
ncbi:unnamed protein product [Tuber melanosporum]|uniref:(Perigord truffle) hypothetical protein n=1 Tax=Tuber melanosporum (strain Mel28) TaxID=656061 RepID=D5GN75_TUBMM|nr:uncharacterized protein GSTUM_00011133001 [Tuber melanosporum]CAZ85968.1 unnamed protein product [Tuber melanosporum]